MFSGFLSFIVYFICNLGCTGPVLIMPSLELRARNIQVTSSYISDFHLDDGSWYSVKKNGEQYLMPDENFMPGTFTCGTVDPIYIQGTHPDPTSLTDTPVVLTACLRDFLGNCSIKYPIQARKCNDEVQYGLVYTRDFPPSGFCFDPPYLQTVPSEDIGQSPADVSLGHIDVEPKLLFKEMPINNGIVYSPYLEFRCNFIFDINYFYTVVWMINDEVIETKRSQQHDQLHITEDELIAKNIPIGVNIRCGVQVTSTQFGVPTPMNSSTDFFAGILFDTTVINMGRKKKETIPFTLTVPVGCAYPSYYTKDLKEVACRAGLHMFDPNEFKCNAGNIIEIKNSRRCNSNIKTLTKGDSWDKNNQLRSNFTIQTVDENTSDPKGYNLHIKMNSVMDHRWWRDYNPGSITVNVVDDANDLNNKYCYAHVDPHMRTSDAYCYENQLEGRFILYKNDAYKIEVQMETAKCNRNRATCACAVAIRAGGDVFRIDLCAGATSYSYIGFSKCLDGGILKVVKKSEKRYQVYTPIGTWIDVVIEPYHRGYRGFMNIDINMSGKDFENTQGLCGYFDLIKANDLRPRGSTTHATQSYCGQHHNAFSSSWKLTAGDLDLFEYIDNNNIKLWGEEQGFFCVCNLATFDGTTINPIETPSAAQCKGTQYMGCISYADKVYKNCKITNRRRRSLHTSHLKTENERIIRKLSWHKEQLKHTNTRSKRNVPEYEITESEAEEFCSTVINSSVAVTNNLESLGEDPNDVIRQCIFDVVAANDTAVGLAHVDALNNIVDRAFEKDPIYVANNTEKVEFFRLHSCPSNCSNNGVCTEGKCVCHEHWHGSDSSIDERSPLSVSDIENDGLCSIADGDDCRCYEVRSSYMLPNFTCRFEEHQVVLNGSTSAISTTTSDGEYEDLFSGICCLPVSHKRKRSADTGVIFATKYDVYISNDGNSFGTSATVFVFDTTCQVAVTNDNVTYEINLKENVCFIDGNCKTNGQRSQSKDCYKCDPEVNPYSWTSECSPSNPSQPNLIAIIGGTVGAVLFVVLIVTCVICLKKCKRSKPIGDSQLFTAEMFRSRPNTARGLDRAANTHFSEDQSSHDQL